MEKRCIHEQRAGWMDCMLSRRNRIEPPPVCSTIASISSPSSIPASSALLSGFNRSPSNLANNQLNIFSLVYVVWTFHSFRKDECVLTYNTSQCKGIEALSKTFWQSSYIYNLHQFPYFWLWYIFWQIENTTCVSSNRNIDWKGILIATEYPVVRLKC